METTFPFMMNFFSSTKKKINCSRTFLFGTIRNLIYSVNTNINNVQKKYCEIVLLEILDKTDRSLYFFEIFSTAFWNLICDITPKKFYFYFLYRSLANILHLKYLQENFRIFFIFTKYSTKKCQNVDTKKNDIM